MEASWKYIVSGHGDHRFVDILPERADKGTSLRFLSECLLQIEKTVAFGDSMNDVDMLVEAKQGVIVANAQKDLKCWHADHKAKHAHITLSQYRETHAMHIFLAELLEMNAKSSSKKRKV